MHEHARWNLTACIIGTYLYKLICTYPLKANQTIYHSAQKSHMKLLCAIQYQPPEPGPPSFSMRTKASWFCWIACSNWGLVCPICWMNASSKAGFDLRKEAGWHISLFMKECSQIIWFLNKKAAHNTDIDYLSKRRPLGVMTTCSKIIRYLNKQT